MSAPWDLTCGSAGCLGGWRFLKATQRDLLIDAWGNPQPGRLARCDASCYPTPAEGRPRTGNNDFSANTHLRTVAKEDMPKAC